MTKKTFVDFLVACAAGGANAPTFALAAAKAAQWHKSSEEMDDSDAACVVAGANLLALGIVDFHGLCAAFRDGKGDPIIEAQQMQDCYSVQFVSSRRTVVVPTDCGPYITVDGEPVSKTHYRYQAVAHA